MDLKKQKTKNLWNTLEEAKERNFCLQALDKFNQEKNKQKLQAIRYHSAPEKCVIPRLAQALGE